MLLLCVGLLCVTLLLLSVERALLLPNLLMSCGELLLTLCLVVLSVLEVARAELSCTARLGCTAHLHVRAGVPLRGCCADAHQVLCPAVPGSVTAGAGAGAFVM